MVTLVKPHSEEGVQRPRAVAHALQMARLLQWQKEQNMGQGGTTQNTQALPPTNLLGSLLYFMLLRIEHCQESHACDPSRSALFYWFDDTFRRVGSTEDMANLRKERGDIVSFLQQEKPLFSELSAALQLVNPYSFVLANVPKVDRLVNETIMLLSREDYRSMLRYLLEQYVNDGAVLLRDHAKNQQILDMKFLLRSMVHMRALARGVGKAALLHEDYLLAAESYSFSGDFFQAEMKQKFTELVNQKQATIPDTCERILALVDAAKVDWFDPLKQIYQDASSSQQFVATRS